MTSALVRTEVLRSLRNRLRLAELWRRRPEILEAPLPPPVLVVGAARSGTSILYELLACDPASRAPAMWEMLHPVEALEGDALRPIADDVVQFWHDLQPEYETMHANSGEIPNECIYITVNEFLSDHWGGAHVVPTYEAHLAAADHREAYRFHRRFLQTLQQRVCGKRWVLKAPSHLFQLQALFDVYPDARIVHTHRDPLKTIPSTLSLLGTLKWMRCEHVDMDLLAGLIPKGLAHAYRAEIEQRADGRLPDDRFVDVCYHDLMADPLAAIGSIYERLGWDFPDEVRQAMASYIEQKPKGTRGSHRYSLEQMGLDSERERERFRFYQARFDVPDE
jgi:hypothetical protein